MELMNQMQQTRATIQQQTVQQREEMQYEEPYFVAEAGYGDQQAYHGPNDHEHGYAEAAPCGTEDAYGYAAEPHLARGMPDSPSASQSASVAVKDQMWDQFMDQRDSITKLTDQVETMRQQLLALGSTAHLAGQEASTGSSDLVGPTTSSGQHYGGERVGPMDVTQSISAMDWTQPLQRYAATDSLQTASLGAIPSSLSRPASAGLPPRMAPFHQQVRGANVELSVDGYTASRTRGCRQAAVLGSEPLLAQAHGRYFEVTLEETVAGWVGGLGIGVSATPPSQISRLPDKAWKMQGTFIVGYWGCIFAEGAESPTTWRPDTLGPGTRVGLLVAAASGEIIVFVDGTPVVRAQGGALANQDLLYPVVDVFSAARSITLREHSAVPPPPWHVNSDTRFDHKGKSSASPRGSLAETSSLISGSFAGGPSSRFAALPGGHRS